MDLSPKWTKTYFLRATKLRFVVLLSEHDGFYASCIWHEPGRLLRAPGATGGSTYAAETRFSTTETDALDQLQEWAQVKFGMPFDLIEASYPLAPDPSSSPE